MNSIEWNEMLNNFSTTMKTAAAVLQEMMVKLGHVPVYECISQTGPQNQCTFEYSCKALNHEVTAMGTCKKNAKQTAATKMLEELARNGHQVPPPYAVGIRAHCPPALATAAADTPNRNNVVLLKELAEEYRLPAVEYELVGDTGPAHMREFTITARVDRHVRQATASTKKTARQLAAEQLYKYLRDNLTVTKNFSEEDALVRAHEKVMERYVETRQEQEWRPDLAQKIASYHLGLKADIDEGKLEVAKKAIEAAAASPSQRTLEEVAQSLGLSAHYSEVKGSQGRLSLLKLCNKTPELAFVGRSVDEAAAEAVHYIRLALRTGDL